MTAKCAHRDPPTDGCEHCGEIELGHLLERARVATSHSAPPAAPILDAPPSVRETIRLTGIILSPVVAPPSPRRARPHTAILALALCAMVLALLAHRARRSAPTVARVVAFTTVAPPSPRPSVPAILPPEPTAVASPPAQVPDKEKDRVVSLPRPRPRVPAPAPVPAPVPMREPPSLMQAITDAAGAGRTSAPSR
jgi:hypothetical protein